MRLDALLVEKGLAPSRAKAQVLIKAGHVVVEGFGSLKPATDVPAAAVLTLKQGGEGAYVSRGALKLNAILPLVPFFSFKGKVVLDVGASTGGFSQVALEGGAKHVYAVDVGTAQLAEALKGDPRLTNLEKIDARTLTPAQITLPPEVMLCDVSFISCTKILPHVLKTFPTIQTVFVLVKPQFELTKADVGSGGIVRSKERQYDALESVKTCLHTCGFSTPTFTPAPHPPTTKKMNTEFMLCGVR